MGRPLEKSKALLREVKKGREILNQISNEFICGSNKKDYDQKKQHGNMESAYWVPHPRTGIYYPKGYERVMEDVPKGAASFQQTYWLRSLEGADKSTTDPYNISDIHDHPFLNM